MMTDGVRELHQSIHNELKRIQDNTIDVVVDSLMSLIDDKQGFDELDDYTITKCAEMIRKFKRD